MERFLEPVDPPPPTSKAVDRSASGSLDPNKPQHIFSSRCAGTRRAHTYFPLIYLLLQSSSHVVILEEREVFQAWKGLEEELT